MKNDTLGFYFEAEKSHGAAAQKVRFYANGHAPLLGLTLERHWRMKGAMEAVDGLLLFGIRTAFVFSMMQT